MRVFQIQRSHRSWLGSRAFDRFHQRAPQLGSHVRRQATEVRDVQRSHKAQRINVSLKPHEVLRKAPDVRRQATEVREFQRSHKAQRINASLKPHELLRKTLLDQKPDPRPHGNDVATDEALGKTLLGQEPDLRLQANEVATDEALRKTLLGHEPDSRLQGNDVATDEALRKTLLDQQPDPRPQGNDVGTAGGQAADRAPDEVQAAPPYTKEREAGRTVAIASVNRAADTAQNTPPPMIEDKGTATTRSLDTLSVVLVMLVVALGLTKFLFRRTYAKRVLAFGAMRLSQPQPDFVRPVDLSWPLRDQVEADSSLESVKKALSTIEEAVGDMSSRQLRRSL
jgi:hypothetical protein